LDEASFDHSSFSANRQRLLEHEVAGEFFRGVVEQARALKLLSGEHFTVDGTLIEAWASLKSFQRKGAEASNRADDDPGNPTVNFHGERRSNETHQSTTDPEALLARKGKGKEAKLYSARPERRRQRRGAFGWSPLQQPAPSRFFWHASRLLRARLGVDELADRTRLGAPVCL
jgi:hypothetical protein